jgi:hypothetical protein
MVLIMMIGETFSLLAKDHPSIKSGRSTKYLAHVMDSPVDQYIFPDSTKTPEYYKSTVDTSAKGKKMNGLSHFRIAINYGLSYRIAKTDPGLSTFLKDYFDELKSGYSSGIDAAYYFNEHVGAGLLFNRYTSSYSVMASAVSPSGVIFSGELSDHITLTTFAPSINCRVATNHKHDAAIFNLALGYTHFNDDGKFITEATIKGNSFALCYIMGYDYGLSKHFAIGALVSFNLGTLTSYDLVQNGQVTKVTLDKDHYENLSRIDLSLGLRYR